MRRIDAEHRAHQQDEQAPRSVSAAWSFRYPDANRKHWLSHPPRLERLELIGPKLPYCEPGNCAPASPAQRSGSRFCSGRAVGKTRRAGVAGAARRVGVLARLFRYSLVLPGAPGLLALDAAVDLLAVYGNASRSIDPEAHLI